MNYDIRKKTHYWILRQEGCFGEFFQFQIPEKEMLSIAHQVLSADASASKIGAQLRKVRKAAKISQEDAAEELGLSRTGLGNIERGATAGTLMTVGTYDAIVKFIVNHLPGEGT